jgi:hypothetical protein
MSTTNPNHETISIHLFRGQPLIGLWWAAVCTGFLVAFLGGFLIVRCSLELAAWWGWILVGVSPLFTIACAKLVERLRFRGESARLSPLSLSVSCVDRRGSTIETLSTSDGVLVQQTRWIALPSSEARPSDMIALAHSRDAERLAVNFAGMSRGTFAFRVVRARGVRTLLSIAARLAPPLVIALMIILGQSYINLLLIPVYIVTLPLAWAGIFLALLRHDVLMVDEQGMNLRSKGRLLFSDISGARIVQDALHVLWEVRPGEHIPVVGWRFYPDSSIPRDVTLTLMAKLINERAQLARQCAQRE